MGAVTMRTAPATSRSKIRLDRFMDDRSARRRPMNGDGQQDGEQHRVAGELEAEVKTFLDANRDEPGDGADPNRIRHRVVPSFMEATEDLADQHEECDQQRDAD